MGYYMSGQARGSFFSSIWHAVKDPVLSAASALPGIGSVVSSGRAALAAVASHPVASAVAGAATASLVGAAVTRHTASSVPATTMPGGSTAPGAMGRVHKSVRKALGMRAHRRMNVTNPRALRRAIRRAHGFEKLAMKVLGFTRPHKPKGKPYFKRTVRRK